MNTIILGNGLVAKSLAKRLQEARENVTIVSRSIDDKTDGVNYIQSTLDEIPGRPDIFEGIDNVIHTMCSSTPASSMADISKDAYENVFLNIKLLDALKQMPLKKLVFLSSGGAIYGDQHNEYSTEADPTNPVSAYGAGKLAIEKYLYLYNYHFGLNYVTLRPSNVYGYTKNLKKKAGVINHLLNCAVRGETFNLWGSPDNKKDYLYVDDLANAIEIILTNGEALHNRTYNLSAGHTISIGEIIAIVERLTGKQIAIEKESSAKFDVSNIAVNSDLFRKDFNWTPSYDVEKGISAILSQYS